MLRRKRREGRETHGFVHVDELEPTVELGYEIGSSRERDSSYSEKSVVERRVLGDTLSEGATLEVDREGRDLLRERDEVDARVEEVGRELGLEVNNDVRLPE